ncbi:MAG: hypothetical protein Ta2F_02570 [Termitinemataceae bacterium]|nr:MAG: hypothetical protein Ta2F_02570 [Termitinemataceae bacterium]
MAKRKITISLTKFVTSMHACKYPSMLPTFEFHIRNDVRQKTKINADFFTISGNVILADFKKVRELAAKLNERPEVKAEPAKSIKAGDLNAMGLIDEILHFMVSLYRSQVQSDVFANAILRLKNNLGDDKINYLLETFCTIFPPQPVYAGQMSVTDYLKGSEAGYSHSEMVLEELLLLAIANLNPAFSPFLFLFDDSELKAKTVYVKAMDELRAHLAECPVFGPNGQNLWDLLRAPRLGMPQFVEWSVAVDEKTLGIVNRQLACTAFNQS